MVEGARLESVYMPKAYQGFESLSLRHIVRPNPLNGFGMSMPFRSIFWFILPLAVLLLYFIVGENPADSNDVELLITQLASERNIQKCEGMIYTRADIAEKLGELGDERAIDPLIDVLQSPDENILSYGASGCEAGGKTTYYNAIDALGKFGVKAKGAIPRLTSMLIEPENSEFTQKILSVLPLITPEHALDIIVSSYSKVAGSTAHNGLYLKKLASFGAQLEKHDDLLVQAVKKINIASLDASDGADLLPIILYAKIEKSYDQFIDSALAKPEVLRRVSEDAFYHANDEMFYKVKHLLENFEKVFPESVFMLSADKNKAYCGGRTIEGERTYVKSQIISILLAMCTPQSFEFVQSYKQESGFTKGCWRIARCKK